MARARTSERVDLQLEGLSCASCASRVEASLNKVEGASASVNFAMEEAAVQFDPSRVAVDELLSAVENAGYGAHIAEEGSAGEDSDPGLRRRLIVAVALSVPLMVVSMVPPLQFAGWEWLAMALAAPVLFYSGAGFHRAALAGVRHRATTMDTLISLGTTAAFAWSAIVLVAGTGAEVYFEVSAVIVTLVLLGRWLESRAKRNAGRAIRALVDLRPDEARLLDVNGRESVVPVDRLAVGDRFVVRPGGRIATDGVVEEGYSAVDASMLTGESVPVDVGPGSELAGATINTGGRLIVRATRVGADTALARITRIVAEAQTGKAPVQRLADRVSAIFVPVVLAISAATLAGWLVLTGDGGAALTAAVAVLIIACPCALGLATPTAIMVGTGRGAQLGILIRSPEAIERARGITGVVLDKTGTLTEGRMWVEEVIAASTATEDEVLRRAGAVERASEHPIAAAIARFAEAQVGELPAADEFTSTPGVGVEATVENVVVTVGRSVDEDVWPPFGELRRVAREREERGRTVVGVAWDGMLQGVVVLADAIKPTARAAVAELRRLGIETTILTGDNPRAAAAVSAEVGADNVLAEVLPADKAAEVRRLQGDGQVLAMVGDGVNDAPALVQADLGMAIGTGTDVAIEAGDVTLVSGDPLAIVDAIALARSTFRTIRGNLVWAFAYNVAAIPLAVAGVLHPMVAAAAMAMSSLFVVTNSLRLRRFAGRRGSTTSETRAPGRVELRKEPA
ncbi:MAG: heavy metal translocating P-type ATPase [Miltoncostaeaceae bacterium]